MKTIEFIADFRHSDDGVKINTYPAGQTLEVSKACAIAALGTGAGREPGKSLPGPQTGAEPAPFSSDQAPAPATSTKPANSTPSARRKKPVKGGSKSSRSTKA